MLKRTKQFLRSIHYDYDKTYIRPLMVPDSVYVLKFGKDHRNNRVGVKDSHTWTGRIKINEIAVRLHKQKHPRIFKNEADMIKYLNTHLTKKTANND